MTDDTGPKTRRADPLMTMTIRNGRIGTVDVERGAPPMPAKSAASVSDSASLRSEKPHLPELPPLPTLESEFSKCESSSLI